MPGEISPFSRRGIEAPWSPLLERLGHGRLSSYHLRFPANISHQFSEQWGSLLGSQGVFSNSWVWIRPKSLRVSPPSFSGGFWGRIAAHFPLTHSSTTKWRCPSPQRLPSSPLCPSPPAWFHSQWGAWGACCCCYCRNFGEGGVRGARRGSISHFYFCEVARRDLWQHSSHSPCLKKLQQKVTKHICKSRLLQLLLLVTNVPTTSWWTLF